MWDFGRLGSAGLWKSGPLFSTGTKEAELMVRELRVEPAVASGAICGVPVRAITRERSREELAPGCPQHLQSGTVGRPQGRASSSPTTAAPPEKEI
jgi:hypothetical protein